MKPNINEYNKFYYTYIKLVEDEDILLFLDQQMIEFVDLITSLEEKRGEYRYEEGKWSIKQVIGHILDTERVMSYRALAISRGDKSALPGFDQVDYMEACDFDSFSLETLMNDFQKLRLSTLCLFRTFTEDQLSKIGSASGSPISARALVYIVAGHLEHHKNILLNKYL